MVSRTRPVKSLKRKGRKINNKYKVLYLSRLVALVARHGRYLATVQGYGRGLLYGRVSRNDSVT